MTNLEKYKEQLLDFINNNNVTPAKVDGEFERCSDTACTECDFYNDNNYCDIMLLKWLYKNDDKAECCENCTYFDTSTVRGSMCEVCNRNYSNQFKPKPKKTRQSEFLEHYPNVNITQNVIDICPHHIDNTLDVCKNYKAGNCIKCKYDYWTQEVEE